MAMTSWNFQHGVYLGQRSEKSVRGVPVIPSITVTWVPHASRIVLGAPPYIVSVSMLDRDQVPGNVDEAREPSTSDPKQTLRGCNEGC